MYRFRKLTRQLGLNLIFFNYGYDGLRVIWLAQVLIFLGNAAGAMDRRSKIDCIRIEKR